MKLLITGAAHPTTEQLDRLRENGHAVWFLQNENEPLPLPAEQVEGVVANGLFLHHDIAQFTSLRYIQLTSAGMDRVPLAYIQAHGITLHHAAGVYSIPMAEFAVSSVLQIYKPHTFFRNNQREHRWEKHRQIAELYGKRVVIVGCGGVGTACAKRFHAFECDVTGVDLVPRSDPYYTAILPLCDMNRAIAQADILLLTVPLTEQTHHLIGTNELALLKDEAMIINLSRGAVLDTLALRCALQKRPLYAVLDVFEQEPLAPDDPLWDHERVIISPHNSFVGEHNDRRLWALIHQNLQNEMGNGSLPKQ